MGRERLREVLVRVGGERRRAATVTMISPTTSASIADLASSPSGKTRMIFRAALCAQLPRGFRSTLRAASSEACTNASGFGLRPVEEHRPALGLDQESVPRGPVEVADLDPGRREQDVLDEDLREEDRRRLGHAREDHRAERAGDREPVAQDVAEQPGGQVHARGGIPPFGSLGRHRRGFYVGVPRGAPRRCGCARA